MPIKKDFPALSDIKNSIKASHAALLSSLRNIQSVDTGKNKVNVKLFVKEQKEELNNLKQVLKKEDQLRKELKSEIKKETQALQSKLENLQHLQDASEANNYLLEYKRKALLIQSEELETANDKIRKQNSELLERQQKIASQVDEIRKEYVAMLERKKEMEEKTEALLDQADYLHEANEIITSMHQELAKQKDEILTKNEELLSLNQEKNDLIGVVAHDLKNPLNQIKGLVTLTKMTAQSMQEEATNFLTMIESSANRLSDMISKILDIEAIESKQLNLNIQAVCISKNINAVLERYKPDAERKQIILHYSPAELAIQVDGSYFDQIIENLLSNALKFSSQSTNIYISEREEEGKVIIKIKDEGPGISESDMKKLFSKYQKLSAKPTGNESSTGLGLSIVKKFVEAMQGKIWCESEEGNGTAFILQFKKA